MMTKKILIVQRRLTAYRVPFFEKLKASLTQNGFDLVLAHGDPSEHEKLKKDAGYLSWAVRIKNHYFFNDKICFHSFSSIAKECDLVILTAENKLVYNLIYQFFLRRSLMAYWGHGTNLQKNQKGFLQSFKKFYSLRVDWWFGYTNMSLRYINGFGYPSSRVSILNNTIDTETLSSALNSVTASDVKSFCTRHNISSLDRLCVFIGSLYEEKMIDFLLLSALDLYKKDSRFELVVAGAGPDESKVVEFCKENSWAKFIGPIYGFEKAILLRAGKLILNPGLVGLNIIDSFVAEIPMVTTSYSFHSPEIEYLETGVNGLMTNMDLIDYSEAANELLNDEVKLNLLKNGCKKSAENYSMDNMVENFTAGVVSVLN